MALPKKKKKLSLEAKLDNLTRIVGRGFAAVALDIADIRGNMATKDDLRRVEVKVDSVEKRLDHELDKRGALEVRVSKIETKLSIK